MTEQKNSVPVTTPVAPATVRGAATAAVASSKTTALIAAGARELALAVAGAGAIALIGQVSLPLPFTPVPVTLGTFAALGVGGVLGSRRGAASVVLFALAAACGAPVLAGWGSGVGATFGYVVGYGLAAVIAGRATRPRAATTWLGGWLGRSALMVVASAAVYVPGLVWLHVATQMSWQATVAAGLVPFVIGDVLKSVAAGLIPSRRH